jgi:hypothetical protein
MLRNSILTYEGITQSNRSGAPQGSPISPILANIYLHYLLDEWFKENWLDQGQFVRYADDVVFILNDLDHAAVFKQALSEHLRLEGKIALNETKSKIVSFTRQNPQGTFTFLGFEFYWGKYTAYRKVLKVKTSAKALSRSIQAFKMWIKRVRNRMRLDKIWALAQLKLIGHYNYYGVTWNLRRLNHFYWVCLTELFKWLNRRSQKRSFTWERFQRRIFFNPLSKPSGLRLRDITCGTITA